MANSERSQKMSKRTSTVTGTSSSAASATLGKEKSLERNWRDTRTASQCLSHLYLSEHLSDVSFTFSADVSVKLPVHKFVLSMRSDVFETMFYGSLAERGETVLIEDIEPEVMRNILRFVYSDDPEINVQNVLPCLYAAKKYNLSGLVQQCSSFLHSHIGTTNVCSIHELAVIYEMKSLQTKCLKYILHNGPSVFALEDFVELSKATLQIILQHDELVGDESDIFEAAVRWAKNKCTTKNKSKVGQSVRDQLGEALFLIRFPLMSIKKFTEIVTPSGILTNEELVMLYQYNVTKKTPLGKFCKLERFGAPVIIYTDHYNLLYKTYSHCSLDIQMSNSPCQTGSLKALKQQQLIRKSVKIMSVSGSFVENVTEVFVRGSRTTDYEIENDKITFINLIDIADNINIRFLFAQDKGKNSDTLQRGHCKYVVNKQEKVKGQDIIIANIPKGLHTITFV